MPKDSNLNTDFSHTTLGNTEMKIHRLGLAATYWPGKKTIYRAMDAGMNFLFFFGFDRQMVHVIRDMSSSLRQTFVVATGAYNLILGYPPPNLRRTLEKRLRHLRTDYLDLFMFLGVTRERDFPERAQEELYRLKEEGKIRAVGMTTHDRKFAGRMAKDGKLDVLMFRYNAAHRGAEEDIFPYLENTQPGVVCYTATRWRSLLRKPRAWPKTGPIPGAGHCYRFVLSNPNVQVCMTAPTNLKQLNHNLKALDSGPLDEEEMDFMRNFGDAVHGEVQSSRNKRK
jgi:aryl-alcohol dehydrogenase-like predicted oxidoreductase